MRFASETSSSAVSSSTRPIDRRYSRSESSDGSTVRSSSVFFGATGSFCPAAAASTLPSSETAGLPSCGHDLDPVLDEVPVERLHLLLGDVHLLEACRDLLVGQVAAFLAVGKKSTQLVQLRERRLSLLARELSLRLLGEQCSVVFRSQPR